MKNYNFYGWQTADVSSTDFPMIKNPRVLYDFLNEIWCKETCAPRMQNDWTEKNKTLGQCSITAFLAQDIFGGKVYGILRSGGNFHCYNVIGDCVFDLTSEQFGNEKLCYENNPEQFREIHFAKEEKKLRYEFLKSQLMKKIESEKKRLDNAKQFFWNDRFAMQTTGIDILEIGEHYAKTILKINNSHLNGADNVMGGAIFTLADFTFAVASNQLNENGEVVEKTVTASSNINFLSRVKGNTLFGESKLIRDGRSICTYEITVTDNENTVVALVVCNGMKV